MQSKTQAGKRLPMMDSTSLSSELLPRSKLLQRVSLLRLCVSVSLYLIFLFALSLSLSLLLFVDVLLSYFRDDVIVVLWRRRKRKADHYSV